MLPDRRKLRRQARAYWRVARSFFSRVHPTPVVILGKEKSGTTAIAALLARHTGLSATLDIQNLWGPAEIDIRTGDLAFRDFVRRNRGAFANPIVKEPSLTFLYPQLREVFPGARIVMIVRDPRDNIRSVFNRLRLPGSLTDLDPAVVARARPGWRVVLDAESQGLQPAPYIEVAAARWNTAADAYLLHRDQMILVRYEDFVRDKLNTIHRLAESLQLPRVNDISDKVDVQYQRSGDRTVSWTAFFGSRNLATIEDICRSRMQAFGYDCVSGRPSGETILEHREVIAAPGATGSIGGTSDRP